MKVGIYTPYLDSFGGGERYMLTIAEILSSGHDVDLFVDKHLTSLNPEKLKNDLGERFGLDLSKVRVTKAPLGLDSSFFARLFFLKKYDLLFYLTDGSIFYSTAKKSIVHFQVPFKNKVSKNLWGKIKLSTWKLAIYNSKFTQGYVEKEWGTSGLVMYPPVMVNKIKPLKKEKIILSVGRFTSFSKSKKYQEMIEAFSNLYHSGKINGWSLYLAGSVEGDEAYLEELKKMATGLPVSFYPNLQFEKLIKLYGRATIYWHAAGFGEEDPTKMEHFGITTVEAMAGGCVPVVINKGGQPEIVENEISGLLWNDLSELKNLTLKVVNDPKLAKKLSNNAVLRSKLFSKNNFENNIKELILSLYAKK